MTQKTHTVLLKFSHGLGDVVQSSVVLKHLAKYRPNWHVDFHCGRGKHTAVVGLCRAVYHDGEPEPHGPYDSIIDLGFWENYNRYPDRPNSKITNCLHEVFGLSYDESLGRYSVTVREQTRAKAIAYFESIGATKQANGRYDVFLLHYEGNTSQNRKNLNVHQASAMCSCARDLGLIPVILDWDKRSPLPDQETIFNPGVKGPDEAPDLWGNFGSGDAETITALIEQACIYIGVDSGPGKCASATDTPSLICWKQLHPMQFHDPAPNTWHLIPSDWEGMPPCEHGDVREYFRNHYQFFTYQATGNVNPEHTLTEVAMKWMEETVGVKLPPDRGALTYRWGFWLPKFHDLFCYWTIIEDVLINDGYKTKLRPKVDDVEYVVDVGSAIGAFATLWHRRNPKAKIACVEVNPKMTLALTENVSDFATVIPRACYYVTEDGGPVDLLDCMTSKSVNVGDSRLIDAAHLQRGFPQWYTLTRIPHPLTLEAICKQVGFPRIDVLKLDCEGSEINILAHCDLSKIGTLFVESHDPDAWRQILDRRFRGWDTGHMHRSWDERNEIWHLVNPNPPPRS